MDLSIVKQRNALKARREPYWQRLGPGRYLGYRPSQREGAGTWIARAYDAHNRQYRLRALGDFGELPLRERFMAAKADTDTWCGLIERGGAAKLETLGDACREYAKSNLEIDARFNRYVYGEPIARIRLQKLKQHDVKNWREALEAKPACIARRKDGTTVTRSRAPATINRDISMLRAALNAALKGGHVAAATAWSEALKPIGRAGRRRTLYLDRNQRRKLVEHTDEIAAPFVRALCLLPVRPGALAALCVRDFNFKTGVLLVPCDKQGENRQILLPPATREFLMKHARDLSPSGMLFARLGGEPWNRHTWKRPIRLACQAAGFTEGVTAYTLRHSVITDLVQDGLDLMTVAQLAGTSVAMIEKHYAHLNWERASQALAGLTL